MPVAGQRRGSCPYCGADPDVPVSARWAGFFPLEPPSQNRVAGNKAGGRFVYRRFRDGYEFLFRAWRVREEIPLPARRRRVVITRHFSGQGKRRDRGNLIGGCKPLLDAMILAALIVDDRESDVEDHYKQERVAGEPGVHILLEELELGVDHA